MWPYPTIRATHTKSKVIHNEYALLFFWGNYIELVPNDVQ